MSRIRVVIDTSVWVDIYLREAHHRDPSQPYTALFEALLDDEFEPIYCRETLGELIHVLTVDPQVAGHYRIDPRDAREFCESIFYEVGDFLEITGAQHVSSDPRDDMFIEAAILGKVTYLVREDHDLREPYVHTVLKMHGVKAIFPKQFRKILGR